MRVRRTLVGVTATLLLCACAQREGRGPLPFSEVPTQSTAAPNDSPSAAATRPPDGATTFEITDADGDVSGGGRQRVEVGDRVRLLITADVSDHVHVHVYDLLEDVTPGQPVEIEFVADIPGVVDVELEDAQLTLLELEIQG